MTEATSFKSTQCLLGSVDSTGPLSTSSHDSHDMKQQQEDDEGRGGGEDMTTLTRTSSTRMKTISMRPLPNHSKYKFLNKLYFSTIEDCQQYKYHKRRMKIYRLLMSIFFIIVIIVITVMAMHNKNILTINYENGPIIMISILLPIITSYFSNETTSGRLKNVELNSWGVLRTISFDIFIMIVTMMIKFINIHDKPEVILTIVYRVSLCIMYTISKLIIRMNFDSINLVLKHYILKENYSNELTAEELDKVGSVHDSAHLLEANMLGNGSLDGHVNGNSSTGKLEQSDSSRKVELTLGGHGGIITLISPLEKNISEEVLEATLDSLLEGVKICFYVTGVCLLVFIGSLALIVRSDHAGDNMYYYLSFQISYHLFLVLWSVARINTKLKLKSSVSGKVIHVGGFIMDQHFVVSAIVSTVVTVTLRYVMNDY